MLTSYLTFLSGTMQTYFLIGCHLKIQSNMFKYVIAYLGKAKTFCFLYSIISCQHMCYKIVSNNDVTFIRLIEKSISSAYDTLHQAHIQRFGSSSGASGDTMDTETSSIHTSVIDLPKEYFQMLGCVGPYLYRDTLLLQKVHLSCFLCA